jgi:NAD(P)-dependent dehydrogenase (short-subunit alcohol dehydrogenase family)
MKKLILGATGSIGSSLAKKIIDDGGAVHLVGRDESSLSALASELNSSFTTCDVLEEDFSNKILNDLGDTPINGLAYCVGSIDLKPLKLTKKSDFMQSFNLNLISATEIIKNTSNNLKQNKGSIVLFSTVAVKKGFTNHAIVASAKGAVEGLTVSLAAEFAPNIRVNCIAPSLTKSKISNFILKNEKIAEGIAEMHPLKRLGEGSDSSAVAHFLLSENSSWITGQIFGVDGGRSSLS